MLVFESALIRAHHKTKLCMLFLKKEKLKGVRKDIKFGLYPEQNILEGSIRFETKNHTIANLVEVMCPGNGKCSLWFEAQEENQSTISVDWCHPL